MLSDYKVSLRAAFKSASMPCITFPALRAMKLNLPSAFMQPFWKALWKEVGGIVARDFGVTFSNWRLVRVRVSKKAKKLLALKSEPSKRFSQLE